VLLLLEPFRRHQLDELLADWGILSDDALVIDPGPDFQSSSGKLILRRFAEHPITQSLIQNRLYVYASKPRPVRLDPATPRVAGVQRTALVGSSETSWMETRFLQEHTPSFTKGQDVPGPIPLAVIAERRSGETLGLSMKGGQLIVVGDASILSNELFRVFGNRSLVSNMIHWCLQQHHLLSIPPSVIQNYRLSLSESDLQRLLLTLMALPAGLGLLGLILRILRR
jgi:ABC-type uncharacterized transport system involved in gliding motility auxiliary subunit